MANVLFLTHRIPYPPNKGDKTRSYHLLRHLLKRHRVFLGTFIDTPEDEAHIDTLRQLCADVHVAKLNPAFAKIRCLNGLLSGDPLTIRYFRDAGLQRWVEQTYKHQGIESCVIFCSAMAQYVQHTPRLPKLVDFVDVDSEKWAQYAPHHHWPKSWIFRRESKVLLAYEKKVAAHAARSFFVTETEVALFRKLAPECAIRVDVMSNGVDTEYFSPNEELGSPFPVNQTAIVFTGSMDHWPNEDGATWFSSQVMPILRIKFPQIHFYIVGRNPTPTVQKLSGVDITVTGSVSDIRPYLQHAAVVVAPLRVARGIQNKVLEAMAMACVIVSSSQCAAPINAVPGESFLVANTAQEYVDAIQSILSNHETKKSIGRSARSRVENFYDWEHHMSTIDAYLPD